MIHAFLAGFAGCIGVLVACVCWNRCSEWMAMRRLCPSPPSPSRQRAVAWGWAGGIAVLFLAMFTSILTH